MSTPSAAKPRPSARPGAWFDTLSMSDEVCTVPAAYDRFVKPHVPEAYQYEFPAMVQSFEERRKRYADGLPSNFPVMLDFSLDGEGNKYTKDVRLIFCGQRLVGMKVWRLEPGETRPLLIPTRASQGQQNEEQKKAELHSTVDQMAIRHEEVKRQFQDALESMRFGAKTAEEMAEQMGTKYLVQLLDIGPLEAIIEITMVVEDWCYNFIFDSFKLVLFGGNHRNGEERIPIARPNPVSPS